MNAHSPLGASSAERWMNCPGSVALLKELELPETDEPDYRADGTAAHEFLAKLLEDPTQPDAWEVVNQKASNGRVCDVEMADTIQVFLDTVRPDMGNALEVYIEHHVAAPELHPLFFGTVDCGMFGYDGITVNDFKYGMGVLVEVEENPQILYYAYGIIRLWPQIDHDMPVRIRIIQPRGFHHAGPVREWVTTVGHVTDFAEGVLKPAMDAIEFDHTLDAGPWCRFCPAKLVCPLMTSLFGAAMTADPRQVIHITDESLGRTYQYTAAVKSYLKALEDETYRRLNIGQDIPGTKLVNKKANRVFKSGAEALFRERFGAKAVTAPELRSPAEMEKIGAEAKKLVHEWAYTPQTGLTVALESDNRPAVKAQTLEQAFPTAKEFA